MLGYLFLCIAVYNNGYTILCHGLLHIVFYSFCSFLGVEYSIAAIFEEHAAFSVTLQTGKLIVFYI